MDQPTALDFLTASPTGSFFLLAGPCVIENEEMALDTAEELLSITSSLNIPFAFKGSYRKANRSRLDSFTGIGDEKALKVLRKVKETLHIPVITDIHEAAEAEMAAEYVDILQIQTDLLVAAANTGKSVNIKKGQFLAPESMAYAVEKVRQSGNLSVSVTDRGTMFGYQDLIVDFRGIPEIQLSCRCPAIMDITHSLQQPNQSAGVTGGRPAMISTIAKAAIAVGADGIFLETHRNPAEAKSDGANMLPLDEVKHLLQNLVILREAVNSLH